MINIISKLFNDIKGIDESIRKVMFKGFKFSFLVCFLALLTLILHSTYPYSHIIYESGLILFRTGLLFAVEFFICAFATDIFKKQNS